MKNAYFLGCVLVFAAYLAGCNKDDDNQPTTASNSWAWNGFRFYAQKTTLSTPGANNYKAAINALDDSTSPENVLHIDFVKVPTQARILHIVNDGYQDDDIRIYAYGNRGAYMSEADANSTAYVYLSGNRVKLIITNALLKPFFGVADTASIRLNANINVQ